MKVVNIKENEDGSADISFEFDTDEEYQLYNKLAQEKNMTLNELLLDIVTNAAEERLKEEKEKDINEE